jgi:hypothetical protein
MPVELAGQSAASTGAGADMSAAQPRVDRTAKRILP